MTAASENLYGVSEGFEWNDGYNAVIEQISLTNVVQSDWSTLRDILKQKLHANILTFLSHPAPPSTNPVSTHTEQLPPAALEPSLFDRSPALPADIATFAAASCSNGLVSAPVKEEADAEMSAPVEDAPVPAAGLVKKEEETSVEMSSDEKEREEVEKAIGNGLGPADVIGGRTLPNWMNESEAFFMEKRLGELLDEFQSKPPFTIQRLCELLHSPTSLHSASGKYLRAIERTLLVTSSWTPPVVASDLNGFLPGSSTHRDGDDASSSSSSDGGTPRYANTPIFSPIPFLARDDDDSADALSLGDVETKAILMSPLLLNSPDAGGLGFVSGDSNRARAAFPSSGASGSSSLFPSSLPPTVDTPSLLETSEITVDELDLGPIPSSVLPPTSTSPSPTSPTSSAAPQPHLISPRPVALSSTTTLFPPTSPSGKSTIALPSSLETPGHARSPPIERRVRAKVSFDDLPTEPEPWVEIPPPPPSPRPQRVEVDESEWAEESSSISWTPAEKEVVDAAKGLEATQEGTVAETKTQKPSVSMVNEEAPVEETTNAVEEEKEVEDARAPADMVEEKQVETKRECRSASPTPDPVKLAAAFAEEKMDGVEIPGSSVGEKVEGEAI